MKVKLTTELTGYRVSSDGDYREYPSLGETLDVPDEEAETLIANGSAVRVEDEVPPPSEEASPGEGVTPLLTGEERKAAEREEAEREEANRSSSDEEEEQPVESARKADNSEKAVRNTTPRNRK